MSESFPERLSRFTPDAAGLDRDALLFAAGRASARPSRPWMALAGALAVSQVLTAVLLWPQPAPPGVVPVAATRFVAPTPSGGPVSPGLWMMRRQVLEAEGDLPALPAAEELVPADPPLHVFADPPAALLE
jgi:hypothetical protein